MIGHVVKHRPGHDLQKATIDRIAKGGGNANRECGVGIGSCLDLRQLSICADWMNVVEIRAISQDVLEFRKCVAAFWPPRLIRRQVAGDDEWTP